MTAQNPTTTNKKSYNIKATIVEVKNFLKSESSNEDVIIRDLRLDHNSAEENSVDFYKARMWIHSEALKKRAENYYQGAKLLLENLNSKGVFQVTQEIKELYNHFPKDLTGPKEFNNFHHDLCQVLSKFLKRDHNQVFKQLQDAEAIYTWGIQREPLVTLTKMNRSVNDVNKTFTVAQIDVPSQNLTLNQSLDYLLIASATYKTGMIKWFDVLESWQKNYFKNKLREQDLAISKAPVSKRVQLFSDLEPWQQSYLKNNFKDIAGKEYSKFTEREKYYFDHIALLDIKTVQEAQEKLNNSFYTIPSVFRKVPGLANSGEHALVIFNESGEVVTESIRQRSGIVAPISLKASQAEKERLTKKNIEQLLKASIDTAIANYYARWEKRSENNTAIEIPFLVQTLVSPLLGPIDYFNKPESKKVLAMKIKLAEEVCEEVSKDYQQQGVRVIPLATNHPINTFRKGFLRVLLASNAAHNIEASNKLIRFVEKFLEQNQPENNSRSIEAKPKMPDHSADHTVDSELAKGRYHKAETTYLDNRWLLIQNALKGYKVALNKNTPDTNQGRQLFLASLEQIMVESIGGIAHSSCKSGKDRKGIELLHTDAMLIYYEQYKELPNYNDTEGNRKKFLTIVADLFLTNHQTYLANKNAPGCFGIKTLKGNLPFDLQEAIEAKVEQYNEHNQTNLPIDQLALHKLNSNLNTPKTQHGFFKKIAYQVKDHPGSTAFNVFLLIFTTGVIIGLFMPPIGLAIVAAAVATAVTIALLGGIANLFSKKSTVQLTSAEIPLREQDSLARNQEGSGCRVFFIPETDKPKPSVAPKIENSAAYQPVTHGALTEQLPGNARTGMEHEEEATQVNKPPSMSS